MLWCPNIFNRFGALLTNSWRRGLWVGVRLGSVKLMKIAIIYASVHHGNTQQIAEAMAESGSVDLYSLSEAPDSLSSYQLVGFGSGIYVFRMHQRLMRWIKRRSTSGQCAFLFSTRGTRYFDIYHRVARQLITSRGFSLCGEFSCRGYDTFGPLSLLGGINRGRPNQNDYARARQFVRQLSKERYANASVLRSVCDES